MVSLVIISLWPKKYRIFPNDSKSNKIVFPLLRIIEQ